MVIQPRITVRGGQNPAYRPSAHIQDVKGALPPVRAKGPPRPRDIWGRESRKRHSWQFLFCKYPRAARNPEPERGTRAGETKGLRRKALN